MRSLVSFAAFLSAVQALSFPGLLGRASQDVCASINAELIVPDLLGIPTSVGVIDTCLCLLDIPLFVQTNPIAMLGVTIAGNSVVTTILTQLVIASSTQTPCTYPDNSVPQCVNGNPCGFSCTNGFTSSGDNCVCNAPSHICDGICTTMSCPSSTPQRRGTQSLWEKRAHCDAGFTACGSTGFSPRSLGAYECVHTATNLESCGGCSIPLHEDSPRGRDCSSIPGVTDVSCYNGACRVDGCMPGYRVSSNRRTCYNDEQLRIIKELIPTPYKLSVDLI